MTRGRLRIYLGAAPGVGKTYAMLGEGRRRAARGTDVVVAVVETHKRPETTAMLDGLELVPRRTVEHRGISFSEMDIDAVLARRPQVALVDELAHTNIPGSRHTKRWEDIDQLLDAGIDVISTLNIQHLESVNDVVESITGVRQQETVPDAVVRAADQIELVDMTPEALRRRMAHGNVYGPDRIDAALGNYFRVGNLTALRELALLWVADRVDEGLERYRSEHGISATWAARQRTLVALTGGPEGETLLRRAAVIAGNRAGGTVDAVHVVRGDGTVAGAAPDQVARLRRLTEDLGGTFHTVVGDDTGEAVLEFARSINATQIVVGSSRRGRWSTALRPSAVEAIVRGSGEIDVHVVTHEQAAGGAPRPARRWTSTQRRALAWTLGIALPLVLTVTLLPFRDDLAITTVLFTFLLGVVVSSLVGGLAPAVVTAVLAGLLGNWFFTPPYGGFTIAQPENGFALIVFIVVGVAIATVVDRSARLAAEASRRGAEANVLASLSTGVLRRANGVGALLDQARETFGMEAAALFQTTADEREPRLLAGSGGPLPSPDAADVTAPAGPGLTIALSGRPLPATDRRLLDAFAAQAGAVLERTRLEERADEAARLEASDHVRTAILAAVSHDLRTPLAAIKAALDTLEDASLRVSDDDRAALLRAATEAAERLDGLLANLLDLSRLQTGAVQPVLAPTSLEEVVQRALAGVPQDLVDDTTDENLPLVMTDAGLLERCVANLVENAARVASSEHPVRLTAGPAPGERLELRIVDRGPGVPVRDRKRMFAPFQRLGDAPAGTGIGLGLAVTRGLADAVGATVEAEDTPGGGLTMVLSVPLATREDAA